MERFLKWKIPPLDDDWDVNIGLAGAEWFMELPDPIAQQAALVSVVTGVLAGALQSGSTTIGA